MSKATLARSAVLLGLLVWSAPSFAEVQNVKVGGEVNIRGFFRKSLRLSEDTFNGVGGTSISRVDTSPNSATSDFGGSGDAFFQQLTALNVNADLTENVSVETRFISQKVWTGFGLDATGGAVSSVGSPVALNLANVTLKELFYSPLTVKIGRQKLWFGRGFIVGSRIVNGDVDPGAMLAADEFSDQTGFDAIRGTLDLSSVAGLPLTVDGVYAKVTDRTISGTNSSAAGAGTDVTGAADDLNLVGFNMGTHFSQWNGEAEAYYWNKRDNGNLGASSASLKHDADANTIGFRGSVAPVEGASLWSELAYQWGHRIITTIAGGCLAASGAIQCTDAEGAAGDPYQAWAANIGLDYTAKSVAWTPTVGGEWIFYSGDDGTPTPPAGTPGGGSAIGGWDPVFRGAFKTLIREFQGVGYYVPAQSGATINGTYNPLTGSTTNQHQLALHASVKPLEDLSVDNRLTWFTTDVGIRPTTSPGTKRKSYLGSEWDMVANYNYTDDVTLGVIYGVFWPGNVFRAPYDDIAQELVSSVSVKF